MKMISIDRTKHLADDPGTGHNRWHPDITPILAVDPGEEVVLETRDASDGFVKPTSAGNARGSGTMVHPLTGPVYIRGAKPGDLLEVEYLEIAPQPYGYTLFGPGAGFLPDLFPDYFIAHWDLTDGWATSAQLPGVRIPDGCFVGTAGVAPSRHQMEAWTHREADLAARGGQAIPPNPSGAVPAVETIAREGLRTRPPRENGGNIDAKQLTRGSKLYLPVNVPGGLYSAGDAHFAQGDGEACLTAIEMSATVSVRFRILEGEAARHGIVWPRFAHSGYFNAPEWAAPRNFIATMGIPVREDGTQEDGDLNLATRNALVNMISLLQERGWTREQAYIICSVAVDLRLSNIVDLPNVTVSAFLPEGIFTRD
jgi:formamidase